MPQIASTVGLALGIANSVVSFVRSGPSLGKIGLALAFGIQIAEAISPSRPAVQGSTTEVVIGANMASPYAIGAFYSGGNRVAQVGYGEEDDVPNAHLWAVDVHSVAGPIEGFTAFLTDFVPQTFDGTDAAHTDGNAVGYFHNNLHRIYQKGTTPETTVLAPHWSGAPDWDLADSLISGKAATGWSACWRKDGKVFASGFPQTGVTGLGVLTYDPRLDSTYPGGSGSHRWASPASTASFTAAKATWAGGANPGLHALKYALGSWEGGESGGSGDYRLVFGMGGAIDQVVVEDFVELANVCDANNWTCNGLIYEPGDRWANLKRICMAGGAMPVWKGGRLGLTIRAPRMSLDTITMADIAEGEVSVPGTRPFAERMNTLTPYFVSPDHKWQSVASSPVQVTDYVTEDGGERAEDWPFDLVTDADQAAQLTGYELVDRREQGPISLPILPRLRGYPPGSQLDVDAEVMAYYGIREDAVIMIGKTTDAGEMRWLADFVTENPDKHAFALALTGTSPPVPTIVPPEVIDGAVSGSITFDEDDSTFDSISMRWDRT